MNKVLSLLKSKEFYIKVFHSLAWLMVLLLVLDIATKWIIQNNYSSWALSNPDYTRGDGLPVIKGFAYIYLTYNTGAAWSFLANLGDAGRFILLSISIIMSIALIYVYIRKFGSLTKFYRIGIALMIPGAVGNLIDRAFYWGQNGGPNGVIDWISFHFGSYVFPTFNIADSCLVIGAILLIIALVIDLIKDAIEKNKSGDYSVSPKEKAKLEKESKEDPSTKVDTKEENTKDA